MKALNFITLPNPRWRSLWGWGLSVFWKVERHNLAIACFALIIFLVTPCFAIQYCKDTLESGNPGGWMDSLKTFDEEVGSCPGAHPELDIWINDVPEPLLTAGFWIVFDPSIEIEDVLIYDGSDLPGPWNPEVSYTVAEPDGPGTYIVGVGGWFGPPYIPIIPDSDGDIIIGRIIFRKLGASLNFLTFSTVPDFDTVVGESISVYDSQINPNTITGTEYSCAPCCTHISTDDPTTISPGGTIDFDATSTGIFCNIPTNLVFSDNCLQGDVNPITGLFTADATLALENCEVCVVDSVNTGSCDDFLCYSGEDCCADVTILGCIEELDNDGICNEEDNCPNQPNGPLAGTCIEGYRGQPCTSPGYNSSECGTHGYCSMAQENIYPPGGNGCGDACECEGNFDDDQDQDGTDAAAFKADFGRSPFFRPCTNVDPCNGDFLCDGDVDGADAAKFKEDFGRSPFSNPCPICPTDPWCVYP